MTTILVVDDHPTNRQFLVTLLGYKGHRLLEAADGAEGLATAHVERPDLIILDISLPDMSGISLVKKIRENKPTSKTPILAITGYPDKFRHKDIMLAGCDAFLVKPINTRVLPEMVEGIYSHSLADS